MNFLCSRMNIRTFFFSVSSKIYKIYEDEFQIFNQARKQQLNS